MKRFEIDDPLANIPWRNDNMVTMTVVYQLQDKIDVAHFLGLEFQDMTRLSEYQWQDVRRYAKSNGLEI